MKPDLSDLSHNYPFLHLSRKFDVSYGSVLALVDIYDSGDESLFGGSELAKAVLNVCRASWRWDMSKAQERGL